MRSLPVSNIVNSLIFPQSKNVLYDSHHSVFDLIMKSLEIAIVDINYAHSDMWYNVLVSNNPIEFTTRHINVSKSSHINSVIFFHDTIPKQLKREDILILHQQISNCIKICTDSTLLSSWLPQDDKWKTVNYGIPYIDPISKEKTIDFIVLNFNNNQNIINVYDKLKNSVSTNSLILNQLPEDLEQLYDILDKTKVCIDFEKRINSLIAASRGCFNITSYDNNLIEYYETIDNLSIIDNILTNCLHQIDQNKIQKQIDIIKEKFQFEIFAKNIEDIIISTSQEVFLL